MGRLAGFKYREVARKLHTFGFLFDRPGPGSYEIWRHATTGRKVSMPHHARYARRDTACHFAGSRHQRGRFP
jgi:predicted RNA binding protein YcfA (HicA-like mRNA interferase family)